MSRRGLEVWRFVGDPVPLARDNIYNEIPTEALLFNCISQVEGHLGVEVQSFAS